MPGYIHHIQWSVSNLAFSEEKLRKEYGLKVVAEREQRGRREVVLQSGSIVFLLSQTEDTVVVVEERRRSYPWLSSGRLGTDSVFNICLHVGDVRECHDRMTARGSLSLLSPSVIRTEEGELSYAVVSSPCRNVIHSLINTQRYQGRFLPGFTVKEDGDKKGEEGWDLLTHIDHVTLVCEPGASRGILDWYSENCGMESFPLAGEEPGVGAVMEDVGMKLNVSSWVTEWLCREEGVTWSQDQDELRNFKLVLAEPLPGYADSHVNKFLVDNGGPGVQHIGLSTQDITHTMSVLCRNGAQFRKPPPTYYLLQDKQEEIRSTGRDPKTFKEFGIMIDRERTNGEKEEETEQFILQIFSFPVFGPDTFFLEIIQRQNSRGFGGGNIRALAQSIIEFKRQREKFLSGLLIQPHSNPVLCPGRRSSVHHCNLIYPTSSSYRSYHSSLDDFYGSKKYDMMSEVRV